MNKRCSRCKETLPSSSFAKNAAKADGKQGQCKECKRQLNKLDYVKNSSKARSTSRKTRRRNCKMVQDYKMSKGCNICGYKKNPAALHLHHRDPATKEFTIGCSKTLKGRIQLESEMEKCDILCGNCHAEIHWPLV